MAALPPIPAARPFFDGGMMEGVLEDVRKALTNGVFTLGPFTKMFESMFASYVGVRNAVAVSSGTSSLEIALRYLDMRGGEVIVPTNTFIATPNSVIFAGGRPVLADIDENTLCIDPSDTMKKITDNTRGIITVHVSGLVCPHIDEICEICEDHKLFLIEDAAHAHGATIDGRKAGALGDAAAFSFYPTKVMTTGEGGMLVTDDDRLAEAARSIRNQGVDPATGEVTRLGYNWRMDELSAILGVHQLRRLDELVEWRNRIARRYEKGLEGIDGVEPLRAPENIRNSYYKFPVFLDESIDRRSLAETLRTRYKIETGTIYCPPCHLQPLYRDMFGYREGDLPVSERVLDKVMTLPIYVGMTDGEVERVLSALRAAIMTNRE